MCFWLKYINKHDSVGTVALYRLCPCDCQPLAERAEVFFRAITGRFELEHFEPSFELIRALRAERVTNRNGFLGLW